MYSGEQVVSWPARELSQLKWMMLATLKSDVKTNDMSWTESNLNDGFTARELSQLKWMMLATFQSDVKASDTS